MRLHLENVSRLPTGLLLAEDAVPYALGTRPRYVLNGIERGGSRELSYPLRSDLRGKFVVGPLEIRIADAFGLVELGRSFSSRTTFVVTPKVVPLPRAVVTGSWLGDGDGRARSAAAAGEDDVVPRAYRDGDELRRVHWRSTARYGELMVRREEQQWRNRVLLLLDTRRGAHAGSGAASSFEFAVSAAASIGVHLAREGLDGQLITDTGALSAPGIFEDVLLNSLAVIRPSRGHDLSPGLAALRGASGLIIAVTGRLSAGAARQLAASRRDAGPAIALLLAVSTWSGPGAGSAGPGRRPGRRRRGPRGGRARHRRDRSGRGDPAGRGLAGGLPRRDHAAGRGLAAAGPVRRHPAAGSSGMNLRLTVTAAVAVILASVSVYPLIETAAWFWAGVGAVIVAAAAGIITRLPTLHAAVAGSVLALIAAAPLLVSPYWGLKVAGAAIVAVTAASRPRLRVLQALACVIIYLAALLIYLNALFASHLSTAGIVPTKASLSYLSTLASQGMAERVFEPPVPSSPGVILLAAGGIGLMAAATDLLAVRLRSPAIAGLPLLALYCVRITTAAQQGGVGATIVFCLAMIGYLALLAADGRERLRIWGRLVTVWHGAAAGAAEAAEAPDTKALAASGRRIGLAAACIALAFPLLVPGISVHDLFKTDRDRRRDRAGRRSRRPRRWSRCNDQLLSTSPRTVLTYTTTARQPAGAVPAGLRAEL